MGKVSKLRVAKLGEVGQFRGGIITGANLRRPPEKKPEEPPKADKDDKANSSHETEGA